ncbi:MAG TPA: hypothetical protein VM891_10860 [Amaricoccus sp.]|nr:hypothetical protein [Amaricoccus sp.]
MDPFGIGITGLGAAGAATFGAFGLAFRARRRRLVAQAASELAIAAATADPTGETGVSGGPAEAGASDRDRIEAIASAQAELALRLDALTAGASAPEEKLQAMAGQLLGLIRDKNATLETAMAGLDQLRARMKALEQMGEPAEARGLFEGLKGRMGELETRAAAGAAALEARLAALASGGGASELAERLARLHEARDAGLEAALARLAPLETRLAGLESGIGAGREATNRLETALAALHGEQAQARSEIAALRAAAETAPVRAEARVEARVEALRAELSGRIEAFERALAARDPQGALDRLADRLEGLTDRLVLIETAETPLVEVAERLAGLHVQKDAAVEAVLSRLTPLEAKLAAVEGDLARAAAEDRQAAVEGLRTRVETLHWSLGETAAGLAALRAEAGAGTGVAEIADRLARLVIERDAEKEAGLAAALARLAPLEAALERLAPLEIVLERLAPLEARLATLEGRDDPAAARAVAGEVATELARLRADAAAQTALFADRLALLEVSLPRRDARQALRAPGATDGAPAAVLPSEIGAAPSEAVAAAPFEAVAEAASDGRTGSEAPDDEAIRALPRIISLHKGGDAPAFPITSGPMTSAQ